MSRVAFRTRMGATPKTAAEPIPDFDILNDIAWEGAYWAEDPDWENPGDGNAITTWRNAGSVGGAATPDTGTAPTYRSSTAAFNNKPTVDYSAATGVPFQDLGNYSLPFTVVVIGSFGGNSGERMFDSHIGATGNMWLSDASGVYQIRVSSSVNTEVSTDTDPHLFIVRFIEGASSLTIDDTPISDLDVGSAVGGRDPITIGGRNSGGNELKGHIAFLGFLDGNLSSEDEEKIWTWAQSHYGFL